MKKVTICIVAALAIVVMHAQNKNTKKPVKPVQKTPVTTLQLKTADDSLSYAMGFSIANFYKQQGATKINTAIVSKAINDVQGGSKTLLTEEQANEVMGNLITKHQEKMQDQQREAAKGNIAEGEKFLAENKNKQGVNTTSSGLEYEVITQGNGPKPTATDTVTVNYKGSLLNGTVFDDSYSRGEPASFPLNRVIAGWTEGVQLMPVGSKYKFYIPYQLGYGINGAGQTIPGGSLLIFEVELLSIKGK